MTAFVTRRSVLFSPGDNQRRMEKALLLGADTVCFDLEDAVAPEAKESARDLVKSVLTTAPVPMNGPERCVRINALASEWWRHDMATVMEARPDTLMVPKAEDPLAITRLVKELADEEARLDLVPGHTRLLLVIETALGVLQAHQVGLAAGPRLGALLFGAEDLAADAGLVRSPNSTEVFVARSTVALAAAALRVGAIDQVFVNFQDPAGLEAEARFARTLGYNGKMVIHPDQIAPVHRAFTPTPAEVEWALKVSHAAQTQKGAFRLEGRMIDAPLVHQAERVLRVARRAGMIGLADSPLK